jgi:hypothetical protein
MFRKTLSTIIAGLWLGITGCPDNYTKGNYTKGLEGKALTPLENPSPPKLEEKVIEIPPTVITVCLNPTYPEHIEKVLEENGIDRDAFDELYKGTRHLRIEANFFGPLGVLTKAYGGTIFAYKKEGEFTYLSTAQHVIEPEDKVYIPTWRLEIVPFDKNPIIDTLSDEQKNELFLEHRKTDVKYTITDNEEDANPEDDIEAIVFWADEDLDSAMLIVTEDIPYVEGLRVGDASMITEDNIYIFGFDDCKELVFRKCSNPNLNEDSAGCYIQPGMSGGLYLVYEDNAFYIVGQVVKRNLLEENVMYYTPIEKLQPFLFPDILKGK